MSRTFFLQKSHQLTELEWNEFNQEFDVFTCNPREAREVLTPDLISDLFDWNTKKQQAVRISFVEDKFYCLLSYEKMRVHRTVLSLEPQELFEYVLNIASPLWYLMLLTEDISDTPI